MTCEELRSELRVFKRKVTGNKDELISRLDSVFQTNDRGWARRGQQKCSGQEYLASGEFRDVFLQTYTKGPRKGQNAVWKEFKTGAVYENRFFAEDVKAVDKASDLIRAFNNSKGFRIYLNKPEIWHKESSGQKGLVEPHLPEFKKFNSNTGWSAEGHPVMQALSHHSFASSGGHYLLCDLQGEYCNGNYVLTDPVVLSKSGEFGATDGGETAMASFFAHHRCNGLCHGLPKVQSARPAFQARSGTTFFRR